MACLWGWRDCWSQAEGPDASQSYKSFHFPVTRSPQRSCQVPQQSLLHATSSRQHSLPGTPSQQLPPSLPVPFRDQVLRVLAKNEKQLSLLRDLEDLKPQKVRTPQGLGTPCPCPHSGPHLWLPVLLPPPQTCPRVALPKITALWNNRRWLLFRKGGNPCPEGWAALVGSPLCPKLGGCSENSGNVRKPHSRYMSTGGMPCSMQLGTAVCQWKGLSLANLCFIWAHPCRPERLFLRTFVLCKCSTMENIVFNY